MAYMGGRGSPEKRKTSFINSNPNVHFKSLSLL